MKHHPINRASKPGPKPRDRSDELLALDAEIRKDRNAYRRSGRERRRKYQRSGIYTKTAIEKREAAKIADSRRSQGRYEVVCECEGITILFGCTDDPGGGMPLNMARLVPWAKNPRVR